MMTSPRLDSTADCHTAHPQADRRSSVTLEQSQPTVAAVDPTSAPIPVTSKILPWLARLGYFVVGRGVLPWHFKKITITGQEHLPRSGAVILAPMHRSRWDAVVVPYAAGRFATGRDVYFMVSSNEIKGFQGWFIRRLGGFPVEADKTGRLRALAASIRHGVSLLQEQKMMVVFPEGDIYRTGKLNPLKTGIAHMAVQAAQSNGLDVKIVPMGLAYNQTFPTWGSSLAVHIGEALSTTHYTHLSSKQAVQAITNDLTRSLLDLDPTGDW
jgi:1-acyl-sn-glycerol-3-phosphate acyltransferase